MDLLAFLPMIVILGAFMFFASRRQRKSMQATIDLHESLHVGDRIHTTSGLQGSIVGIDDDTIDLEIAPGVVTTWLKLAVRERIEPDAEGAGPIEADAKGAGPIELTKTSGTFDSPGTVDGDVSASPDRS